MNLHDLAEWFKYADEDYTAAMNGLKYGINVPRQVGWFCQQATEKYLKGYLEYNDCLKIPLTHDLEVLLDLCLQYDQNMEILRPECEKLTQFDAGSRYPFHDPITLNEAKEAVNCLKNVYDFQIIKELRTEAENYAKQIRKV